MTEQKVEEVAQKQPVQETQTQQMPQKPNTTQSQGYYSGFWVRGAAHIIDGVILGIVSLVIIMPLSFVIGFVSAMSDSGLMSAIGQTISTLIGFAVGWGYYVFMTHKFQATLGKMAVGVRVVDDGGQKLSLGKVILRETIGKFVSGVLLGIGYLMVAFTSKKQGLHDMISQSTVVYKDVQKGANNTVVTIVYVVYGLIMTAFLAMIVFFVVVVGVAAVGESGAFSLDSFMEGINDEITDNEIMDDDYFVNDGQFDEMPLDMEELEQWADEVEGDY